MKNIRVTEVRAYVVIFENEQGRTVSLPLYAHDGQYKNFGSYQIYGVSRSDPTYSAVFALPYKWRAPRRIVRAIQKARRHGG